jgi:hypothetical protein
MPPEFISGSCEWHPTEIAEVPSSIRYAFTVKGRKCSLPASRRAELAQPIRAPQAKRRNPGCHPYE